MKYFYVIMLPISRPYYPSSVPDTIFSIHPTRKEAREKLLKVRIEVSTAYIKRAYGDIEEINKEDSHNNTWETAVYEAIKRKKLSSI